MEQGLVVVVSISGTDKLISLTIIKDKCSTSKCGRVILNNTEVHFKWKILKKLNIALCDVMIKKNIGSHHKL